MVGMRYSISEVARYFGTAVSALRYYDQIGLLRPAGRRGTVRAYGRDELYRLALIQLLHQDGLMSLAETATAISGNQPGGQSAGRLVIAESMREMQHQIQRLREAERVLEHLLTCPRKDPIRDCPVLRAQLEHTVDTAIGSVDGGSP